MNEPLSAPDCSVCGLTADELADEGVNPFYIKRGCDGVIRCGGCEAIREANHRFAVGDW